MKLYTLSITRLHHAEAGQFIVRLLTDVKNHNLDLKKDPICDQYINSLTAQSETFKLALQQLMAQQETEEIMALDLHRDHKLATVEAQINVYKYSDIKEEQNAYKLAKFIMKKYKGIAALNYEEETIQLDNLLTEWTKADYTTTINALQLSPHLDNLKKSAATFTQKFDHRSAGAMLKEVFDTKMLRLAMIENYNHFTEYVLPMARNHKENPLYTGLMDAINNGRKYFADLLARRSGGAEATPESEGDTK